MTYPADSLLTRQKVQPGEVLWWTFALVVFFAFPRSLGLAASVLVVALFVLSYDLLLGFSGIVSLGHAMFFGIGAYTAALLSLAGWREPIMDALLAAAVSAVVASITAPFILRLTGLPLLMVTLAISETLLEAANKLPSITGGDDGLSGVHFDPLFGKFAWSITGGTTYLYVLAWLALSFYAMRRILASPFGVALRGIRENRGRMELIGSPVMRHLVVAYAVAAFFAGLAGALWTQSNSFVGLGVLSLGTMIDALVMLVLGGVGHLYGALVGAPVYMLLKNFSQALNPSYWMIVVGTLLVVVVRFARGGILGMLSDLACRFRWIGRQ